MKNQIQKSEAQINQDVNEVLNTFFFCLLIVTASICLGILKNNIPLHL